MLPIIQKFKDKAEAILAREQEEQRRKRLAEITTHLSAEEQRAADLAKLAELTAETEAIRKAVETKAEEFANVLALAVTDRIAELETLARVGVLKHHAASGLANELEVPDKSPAIDYARVQGIVARAVGARFKREGQLEIAIGLDRYLPSYAQMSSPGADK